MSVGTKKISVDLKKDRSKMALVFAVISLIAWMVLPYGIYLSLLAGIAGLVLGVINIKNSKPKAIGAIVLSVLALALVGWAGSFFS